MKWSFDLKGASRPLRSCCIVVMLVSFVGFGGIAKASTEGEKQSGHDTAGSSVENATEHSGGATQVYEHPLEKKSKNAKGKKKAAAATAEKDAHAAAGGHGGQAMSAEVALKVLMDGNKRYVSEKSANLHRDAKRRKEVAAGQHPFAIIMGCSDSRVPPELLFDQGFGDLFVVRTAGNIVDSIALGSMEYAVEHLGVRIIVVLGHERCGAVDATVKGGEAPGNLKTIVDTIRPAVDRVKSGQGDLLARAVRSNVKMVAERIRSGSPILGPMLDAETIKIVGAYYGLDDGTVAVTYMP